jgi:pimeloyl-ACP methyl ester carboxylesterase
MRDRGRRFGATNEPGTDRFAKRFHQVGLAVLAFDYRRARRAGKSGQPESMEIHEQVVEAELLFLRRRLVEPSVVRPGHGVRPAGMKEIELSAGRIEYVDTGGDQPTVVLLHGLLMNASLWDGPLAELSADHRCIAPTLPFGAHRHAVQTDAELSMPALARLVAEFLDRLDLQDVTLVGSDTGGALVQLLAGDRVARVARIVLVSCDAFDNFPPGLTGRTLALTAKLSPSMFGLFMQQMRLRMVRRLPLAFGWLTLRGDAATARWIQPLLKQPEIRRDTVRMLRESFADSNLLLEAAERLPTFDRPALVVWAANDRVMPRDHGRRLADLFPLGELVEIDDSYTLVPLDQPMELARVIRAFAAGTA